jgi:hypothetical protein
MQIDQGYKEELSINHVVKKTKQTKLHQSCDKQKVSINHVVRNKRYQSSCCYKQKLSTNHVTNKRYKSIKGNMTNANYQSIRIVTTEKPSINRNCGAMMSKKICFFYEEKVLR